MTLVFTRKCVKTVKWQFAHCFSTSPNERKGKKLKMCVKTYRRLQSLKSSTQCNFCDNTKFQFTIFRIIWYRFRLYTDNLLSIPIKNYLQNRYLMVKLLVWHANNFCHKNVTPDKKKMACKNFQRLLFV